MNAIRSGGPLGEPPSRRGLGPEAHVLIVEDDASMRHLIARLLRENGFRSTGVRDGREMWETLRNTEVDLVLLDVMLPGDSGIELLRKLRAERGALPVVMVTAKGSEADRQIGLEGAHSGHGCHAFDFQKADRAPQPWPTGGGGERTWKRRFVRPA